MASWTIQPPTPPRQHLQQRSRLTATRENTNTNSRHSVLPTSTPRQANPGSSSTKSVFSPGVVVQQQPRQPNKHAPSLRRVSAPPLSRNPGRARQSPVGRAKMISPGRSGNKKVVASSTSSSSGSDFARDRGAGAGDGDGDGGADSLCIASRVYDLSLVLGGLRIRSDNSAEMLRSTAQVWFVDLESGGSRWCTQQPWRTRPHHGSNA